LIFAASLFSSGSNFAASDQANSNWLTWASVAWSYYQPGVGINPRTGLSRANLDWDYATDWDLGTNIISVILARRVGLIGDTTPTAWGFRDRINRILYTLENRTLGSNNGIAWPYWAYDWDGSGCGAYCSKFTDTADSARLLAALDMLRNFDKSYTAQVEAIYERTRAAYDEMAHEFGAGYYEYYYAKAYEAWGYNESVSLQDFQQIKNLPTISVYGVQIPKIPTAAEPTLFVLLELDRSRVSTTYLDFAERMYETQMARYLKTGLLTAWSEGGYFSAPYYVYETIYDPTAPSPGTWVITGEGQLLNASTTPPIMYTKVAFAYLAIYGANSYTDALTRIASTLASSSGFGEGTFEDGSKPPWASSSFYSDKTNELVLASSAYALSMPTSITSSATSTTITSTSQPTPQVLLAAVTGLAVVSSLLVTRVLRNRKSKHLDSLTDYYWYDCNLHF